MRIAVIHSNADFLLGPRLPLLRHLASRADVVAMAPRLDAEHRRRLAAHGVRGVAIDLRPTGLNPVADVLDLFKLARRLRQVAPDAVLTNTIKPVTLGTLAARLAGVPRRYALISGLGFAFIDDGRPLSLRKRIVRLAASGLYRAALPMTTRVVFHNRDDLADFVAMGLCPADRARWVNGSGIDTSEYRPEPGEPRPTFVSVSRLLRDKGVLEYLEAARIVKSRRPDAEFLLVGDVDPNPSAIDREVIQRHVDDSIIEWAGRVSDVRPWLRRGSVFVLPSYREGVPRSTLEAMALGMAVITTDAPGCRETVVDGRNGLLVPVRDPAALAAAMERLAGDLDLVAAMGTASREIAVSTFDTAIVHRALDEAMGW